MKPTRNLQGIVVFLIASAFLLSSGFARAELTPNEELGKSIFFDNNLSYNSNLSCAACHAAAAPEGPPPAMTRSYRCVNGAVIFLAQAKQSVWT